MSVTLVLGVMYVSPQGLRCYLKPDPSARTAATGEIEFAYADRPGAFALRECTAERILRRAAGYHGAAREAAAVVSAR